MTPSPVSTWCFPDYTYVLENEEKLRGIIVTHGHEDHTGSLPYLLQDLNNKVPIFSSKLTLGFIEGKLSELLMNTNSALIKNRNHRWRIQIEGTTLSHEVELNVDAASLVAFC